MTRKAETFAMTVLLVVACCNLALGQSTPHTILNIEVQNIVIYVDDVSDKSTYGTRPNVTPAAPLRNFGESLLIGDIVSVNGQPAKGITVHNLRTINLRTAPTPGQAISDVMRTNTQAGNFEILKSDGTPIGSIMFAGMGGAGPAPPGAPLAVSQGNNPIVGGTGAYLGVRGQSGQAVTPQTIGNRQASMTEDPANRRQNGGGRNFFVLDLIPESLPEIVNTTHGPAVMHFGTSRLVYPFDPAAPAERLSLFATGLGPTVPGVDPGQPFPSTPLPRVNSPVEVLVNGQPAEVLSAVGIPSCPDTISRAHTILPATVFGPTVPVDADKCYQIDFRLPAGATGDTVNIQLRVAFIAGHEVSISTR